MTNTRADFLATARSAVPLLREPAVAAAWSEPSALPKMSVGALAGHLAFQILIVPDVLTAPPATEPVVPVLGHYERSAWVGADLDDAVNAGIREGSEQSAAVGAEALTARADAAIQTLARDLPTAANHPVHLPFWGSWALTLDDLLVTRMMELAVHSDDLAVSVGVPTPALPDDAAATVIDLLTGLAVRRHGPTPLIRAFSRAERSPATIAAF